jgi:hypothetical protein
VSVITPPLPAVPPLPSQPPVQGGVRLLTIADVAALASDLPSGPVRYERTAGMPEAMWQTVRDDARRELGTVVEAVSERPLSRREMGQLPVPVDRWKQRRWWTRSPRAKRA